MDIMVEFTDTGLGKLMMGYGLYMHGEVDRAFDMFGASILYIRMGKVADSPL